MRNRLSALLALAVAGAALSVAAPPSYAVGDRDCGDFASQRAAQIFYLKHGGPQSDPHRLDSDSDGIACEDNDAPYYYGRSLPDADPKPKRISVRSSVDFSLNRGKAITGEAVRMTAVVKPRGVRTLAYQRKSSRRWRTFDRDRTNRRGKDSLTIRAPRSATEYRVVVLRKKAGNKTFTSATSRARDLAIQRQSATLVLSRTIVAEDDVVTGTVRAAPTRVGRQISLQILRNGVWNTIRTGRENRRGRETFRLPTSDTGTSTYRAVIHRSRGAAAVRSPRRTLLVEDVTPPAVPTGVSASALDSAALLTWTGVADGDLDHYLVSFRASPDGAWTDFGGTFDTSITVTGLQNGTLYGFTVRSVDTDQNRSARSVEVFTSPTTS